MSMKYISIGKDLLNQFINNLPSNDQVNDENLVCEAYEIQNRISALCIENNDSLAGYKVGCTSPTIQKKLNIQHPIFGRLFHSEIWPSRSTLPLNQFRGLAIEGELAVRLRERGSSNSNSGEHILNRIESIFPVIELHHFEYLDSPFTAPSMIASNAIHAGFVHSWENEQNADRYPEDLSIEIDGKLKAHVSGPQLMETVENSINWLDQQLTIQGFNTKPGQIILSGSLCDLFSLPKGGQIKVWTDSNQLVECTIEKN